MRRRYPAMVAALVALIVAWGATLPEEHRAFLHSAGELHPYYHFGIFAVIALLTSWSVRSVPMRVGLCVAAVALGCATEITEAAMYHGPIEWTDMVLDAMGAVAGAAVGALVLSLVRRRTVPFRVGG